MFRGPMQARYDFTQGATFPGIAFSVAVERDYEHSAYGEWNSDVPDSGPPSTSADIIASHQYPSGIDYLVDFEDAIAKVEVARGKCEVIVHAESYAAAERAMEECRRLQPKSVPETEMSVPINFWSYGRNGPAYIRRDVEGLSFSDIRENYAGGVRTELDKILGEKWRPQKAGQLLLWTGPPGTGKTHAIRALAHEWRDWCGMHYVTDPEKFFGSHTDYMMQVLLRDADDGDGDDDDKRWQLLILEDAGEFLAPDAKLETGAPALSRFLNVVDGLIGHGLKILVLVTTNEPVTSLHEAVARPGRCAADVRFEDLQPDEAKAWLEAHGADGAVNSPKGKGASLAELYSKLAPERIAPGPSKGIGFSA